jgi:alkylhydroperoxidase family enzyme
MRVTVTPEQIRSAFEAVKDDPSFDESRGLWERGHPPVEMIQAMCLRPEILRAFAGFGNSVYPGGLLERRVKELVIITASHTNDCQFCVNSHCDLVDIAAIVDEPLVAIERPETLAIRERLAIEYTRAVMADSNAIPERLAQQLHEQFTDPELVELTFLVGYINMLNLFNNSLDVRYHGEYSLLRPLAG